MRALIVIGLVAMSTPRAAVAGSPLDYAKASEAQLLDDLVNVDAQTPGFHSTGWFGAFFADGSSSQFEGGVLGSSKPASFPQMAELVRRGVRSLPGLIEHLNDARPTKLAVGGQFFMAQYFSDEYDPRTPSPPSPLEVRTPGSHPIFELAEREFSGAYTVRVGDVCYVLIGQIVDRNLFAVRYQPSAILVVNSPIETPSLVEKVKADWTGLDSDALMASLIRDAHATRDRRPYGPALRRLHYYFPAEYLRQRTGGLREEIQAYEAAGQNQGLYEKRTFGSASAKDKDAMEEALLLCKWAREHGAPNGAPLPTTCSSAPMSIDDALKQASEWWFPWFHKDDDQAARAKIQFGEAFRDFQIDRRIHPAILGQLLPQRAALPRDDWRARLVQELEGQANAAIQSRPH